MVVELNKQSVQELRLKLELALMELAEAEGLEFKLGSITYGEVSFHVKLEARKAGLGLYDTPEARAWYQHAWRHGLKDEHLGKLVVEKGEQFRVIGWNKNASTRPVMLMNESTGSRNVVAPVAWLKARLQAQVAEKA